MTTSATDPSSTGPDGTGGYLNAKTVSPSGKVVRRTVTSTEQLKSIVTRLEQENIERTTKNSRIMSRYNAEAPYSPAEMTAQGTSWKSNFSTRPLASIVDRLAPRYVRAVQGMRFITNSKLRPHRKDAAKKSDLFRREVTSLLRGHRKWKSLLTQVAQENALFGYTVGATLDDVSWMPRTFKQDEFFVPMGTGQFADDAQVVVLREDCLPSELFSRIEDKEIAEDAGWDVEAAVKAINSAQPTSPNDDMQNSYRSYQDLMRDGSFAYAHSGGATSVKLWHVLVTETTGKVTHYILAGKDREPVFKRHDRYARMADCATFFTFQQGNGRIHGSLGVGRLAYNIASVVDRARCEVVDREQLASKILITCDPKDLSRFKLTVMGSAAVIGSDYQIVQQKIESGVESFIQLDRFLNGLLNETAGNVTPDSANLQGERVTATAVNVVASREEELRDIRLERFIDAFSDMVSAIQRRLADPDVAEADVVVRDFRKRLLAKMPLEEFNELCECPASETIEDFTDDERQRLIIGLKEWANDPFVDQAKVRRRLADLQLGEEIATEILVQPEDPAIIAAAQRQQLLEIPVLDKGAQVPVLPTDNHKQHWEVLKQAAAVAPSPEAVQAYLAHGQAHAQASADAAFVKQVKAESAEIVKQVTEAQAQQEAAIQEAAMAAAAAGPGPEALPPEMQLPPEAVTPPGELAPI